MKDEDLDGKKVIVALSGGEDSLVVAYLLKKQGMKVICAHFSCFPSKYLENGDKAQEEKIRLTKKLADHLKVNFIHKDISKEFEDKVISPQIERRLLGKKEQSSFEVSKLIIEKLDELRVELDCDYMATGHFAKVHLNFKSNEYSISANNDAVSDQSSLLGGIKKRYLENLILPLGDLKKSDTDKIVKSFSFKIETSIKEKTSLKDRLFRDRLASEMLPLSLGRKGHFINNSNGSELGEFTSHFHYEVGDKNLKGATPIDKNLEILFYDSVRGNYYLGNESERKCLELQVSNINWAKGLNKSKTLECYIKTEKENKFQNATVIFKNNETCLLILEEEESFLNGEVISFYERSSRSPRLVGQGEMSSSSKLEYLDRVQDFRQDDENETKKGPLPFEFRF